MKHGVLHEGKRFQTLMGVTGSGKTFSMAHTVAKVNKPTLVISHNKNAMDMAEQLIGVTMQENGDSRIVAVDMESAVSMAEAA